MHVLASPSSDLQKKGIHIPYGVTTITFSILFGAISIAEVNHNIN